ncbi:MAG TPA: ribose 5-phosphate isomerase B [Clostridia bacterium]|nr:ribose 5-phosphate isomerase B [Clostridia bacterium]
MKIAFGCDHGGYDLKEDVMEFLKSRGIEVLDFGTHSTASVDYPDYGRAVGEAVQSKEADLGIVICGTGIGIALAANKVEGIRAAVVSDTFSARMARMHNNANVLAFGSRVVGKGLAIDLVKAWLDSSFEGGRHKRRVDKIMAIEG